MLLLQLLDIGLLTSCCFSVLSYNEGEKKNKKRKKWLPSSPVRNTEAINNNSNNNVHLIDHNYALWEIPFENQQHHHQKQQQEQQIEQQQLRLSSTTNVFICLASPKLFPFKCSYQNHPSPTPSSKWRSKHIVPVVL